MFGKTVTPSESEAKRVTMIVAYPGHETLWAGGHILSHPNWQWHIVAMWNGSNTDQQRSFGAALARLGATGEIVELQVGQSGSTAAKSEVTAAVHRVLDSHESDLLITHSPLGESTGIRNGDILGRYISEMWGDGRIVVPKLWLFAYEDSYSQRLPCAIETADRYTCLSEDIWSKKKDLLLNTYYYCHDSFVARACPSEEAFYCFGTPGKLRAWSREMGTKPPPLDSAIPPKKRRYVVA